MSAARGPAQAPVRSVARTFGPGRLSGVGGKRARQAAAATALIVWLHAGYAGQMGQAGEAGHAGPAVEAVHQATHAGEPRHASKATHTGEASHAGKATRAGEATRTVEATHAGETVALPDAARFGADYARFARQMDQGMQQMMHGMHAAGYSGNPDADFLAMMIAHHQGAVDMARLQLVHGRDPLARALAEEIIAGQTTEIAAMRARLGRLRGGADAEPDGFPALGATRGVVPADSSGCAIAGCDRR